MTYDKLTVALLSLLQRLAWAAGAVPWPLASNVTVQRQCSLHELATSFRQFFSFATLFHCVSVPSK